MTNVYLLAIYPNLQAAERAVSQLLSVGYTADQLGVANSSIYGESAQKATSDVTNLELNIFAGILRQLIGHWSQSTTVHIAGIGELIVLGIFSDMVKKMGRFAASLDAIGVSSQRIELILESLRQGDAIVCIRISSDRIENASSILCQYKPIDVELRTRQWRMRGWKGFDAMSDPYSAEEIIRKKRQYTPPRTDNIETCTDGVLQFYRDMTSQDA